MSPFALLIFTGAGLGLAYAAAPGAVNTEAVRRGLAHGGRSALLVEVGSLIGDSLWAVLALTGVALFARHPAVQVALGVAGGCFLLRMAWIALHDAWVGARPRPVERARGDFATGAFFGLANPVGLAFWSGLGSGVVASGVTGSAFILFMVGYFCGATLWCLGIAALLGWGGRWVRPGLFRWINLAVGAALGYFGIRLLWAAAQDVLDGKVSVGAIGRASGASGGSGGPSLRFATVVPSAQE